MFYGAGIRPKGYGLQCCPVALIWRISLFRAELLVTGVCY